MKDILIDIKLIDQLKNISGFFNWSSNKTSIIVPWDFMHEILFDNNSIDKSITEFYFKSTRKLLEKKSCRSKAIDNDLEHLLYSPYPFIIEGAFFSRESLCNKLNGVAQNNFDMQLNGKKNIKTFLDLKPYFTEYAEGFRIGFNEFENDKIKPHLPLFANREDFSYKVFEYLTRNKTWTNRGGFTLLREANTHKIYSAFNDGQLEGYYYKAWCIIFSQNRLFAPLFQKHSYSANFKDESKAKAKLTIHQIALICVYENITVNRKNCNKIIESFGLSSGEALYQKFRYYTSQSNRTGIDDNSTSKKVKNKIRLHEIVIKNLSNDHTEKAIRELKLIKERAKKYNY